MLNVITVDEAIDVINSKFNTNFSDYEIIDILNSNGRILAETIVSQENIPPFNRSTMDGYALIAADTFGASDTIPCFLEIVGEIKMGEKPEVKIKSGECIKIATGGMIPEGANAVIPVEYTNEDILGNCLLYKSVSPDENINCIGDDVCAGDSILKNGTVMNAAHISVCAAIGKTKIKVYRKPVVGVISTGDELVNPDEVCTDGKIRDINSYLLCALMNKYICEPKKYGIIKDSYEQLKSVVVKASDECDIILISGGSSAGERDMTAAVINDLGELIVHGLAMKPGKPTIIGSVNNRPVFGLPGHPAACYFVVEVLLKQFIYKLTKRELDFNEKEYLIDENISSNNGREEYICVKIKDNYAHPLYAKSGIISVFTQADGYIRIPRDCEGLKKHSLVRVMKF